MGTPARKGKSWADTLTAALGREVASLGEPAAAAPVTAVDTAALAELVARAEAAVGRLEALSASMAQPVAVSAAVGQPVKLTGPLLIHPLPQFAAVELEELGPPLDLDALELDDFGGWEDDDLSRYRAASMAVAESVRTQLRLHGQLEAETLGAQLAAQYDLSGADAELLSREVRSAVETDWQTVLEEVDTDMHGLPCSWRVIEPAEVCEAVGIRDLRYISGDAPAAWREMVGHWLYRQVVKHETVAAADRKYGQFAELDWSKRLEWNRQGERSAKISAGLKARALVGQGVCNA